MSTARVAKKPRVEIEPRFQSKRRGKGKAPQREAVVRSPTPAQPAPASQPRKHTCCDNPNVTLDEDGGNLICTNCYTQITESNIVAEITFEENAGGGATVQGEFIGENARHASTLGQAATHIAGAVVKSSEESALKKGQEELNKLCPRLGLTAKFVNQALSLYKFAARLNFAAGRRTDEVVGACLYAVCRREKDNTIMLIDIAEILRHNVFRLGEVYKALCKDLFIDHDPQRKAAGLQQIQPVEVIVERFCGKLEFGSETKKVAEDAVRIIQRMKRDWMVTGRHPAGLCGGAIILAARMNNFRRSVREVVYVVKVTDMTILKRVSEFRRSAAAALAVDTFRKFGTRLKQANDPPILYESELKKEKFEAKKRKRQEASEARDAAGSPQNGSGGSSGEESPEGSALPQDENDGRRKRQRTTNGESAPPAAATQQEPRRDADGFLIPALPVDNTQANGSQQNGRKRGRPRKQDAPPPIVITDEELITEQHLEDEISYVIKPGSEAVQTATDYEIAMAGEYAARIGPQQKVEALAKSKERREAEGITWVGEPPTNEEATAEELEKEFADDPEVVNCLLSEEEQNAKEKIWIFNNEDWLRQQQEKKLIQSVAKAAGRNEKGKKATKNAKTRKRRGKIGDGTLIREHNNKNKDTPIQTPADATGLMLRERSPHISTFINQAALQALFRHSPSSNSDSSPANQSTPNTNKPSAEQSEADASSEDAAGDDDSSTRSTPAPTSDAGRIQSPPITQQADRTTTAQDTPERRRAAAQPPVTPPQTQAQATGGAEADESEGDEDDYVRDEDLDLESEGGSPYDFGGDDGEGDFQSAIDPTNRWALDDDAYGNDDYGDL